MNKTYGLADVLKKKTKRQKGSLSRDAKLNSHIECVYQRRTNNGNQTSGANIFKLQTRIWLVCRKGMLSLRYSSLFKR